MRSCYHLMFPKRSHAPAHGVLIIKDPGISNGCQFRHSLLAFRRNIRFPLSVCSSGMYSEKEVRAPLIHRQLSVRSRSFSYLFPSSLFSVYTACFNAAIWVIIWRFRSFVKSGSPEIFTFSFLPSSTLPFINFNATIKLTKSRQFGEEAS